MNSFLVHKEELEKKIKRFRELQKESESKISNFENEFKKTETVNYDSDFLKLVESINERELCYHQQKLKTYKTKEKSISKELVEYKAFVNKYFKTEI